MNQQDKINRVIGAVVSLAKAAAAYMVEDEHHSMSGTWEEEEELRAALKDVFSAQESEP